MGLIDKLTSSRLGRSVARGLALGGLFYGGVVGNVSGEADYNEKISKSTPIRGSLYKEWETAFGDYGDDIVDITPTSDGYLTIGDQIAKFDSNGGLQDVFNIKGLCVDESLDGGYFMASGTGSSGGEFFVRKLNREGNVIWTRVFGGYGYSRAGDVLHTPDNGCLVAGYTYDLDKKYDALLIKYSSGGKLEWFKTYGDGGTNFFDKLVSNSNNTFTVYGTSFNGKNEFCVREFDLSGETIFSDSVGLNSSIALKDGLKTSDGGYLLGGDYYSFSDGKIDQAGVYLKTDSNLGLVWGWLTSIGYKDSVRSLGESSDRYFIAMRTQKNNDVLYSLEADKEGGFPIETRFAVGEAFNESGEMLMTSVGEFFIGSKDRDKSYLAKFTFEPQSYPIGNYPDLAKLRPDRDSLVVLMHGWRSSPDIWSDYMGESLEGIIDVSRWQLLPIDWSDSANVSLFSVDDNAADVGHYVGEKISSKIKDLKHVHLIGHSAGGIGVNKLADVLRKNFGEDLSIHTTFLDLFIPNNDIFRNAGKSSDWTDNYYSNDILTWGFTGTNLEHAHNVPLLAIPFYNHNHPWGWYQQTINDFTDGKSNDYGIIRSLEVGGEDEWSRNLNDSALQMGNSSFSSPSFTVTGTFVPNETTVVSQSPGGYFASSSEGFVVGVSSDKSLEDLVWIETVALVPNSNAFKIDYETFGFPGEISVMLNGELVYRLDGKIRSENNFSEEVFVDDLFEEGENVFGFRFDGGEDNSTSSGLIIKNIDFLTISPPKNSVDNWEFY